MIISPERTRRPPQVRGGAKWLIGAGVVLNAILFVTMAALALYHASANALGTFFVIVIAVTVCVAVTTVTFIMALRRGHYQHTFPGTNRRTDGPGGAA